MTEPRKKLHETPIGSFVRILLHAVNPKLPILICTKCKRADDEVIGNAGDFSVCDRCTASITSKTGLAVRKKEHSRGS